MKKIMVGFFILVCFLGSARVIRAEEKGIESHGNISFEENEIKMKADDFRYLEQEMKAMETGGGTGNRKDRLVSKGNINFNNGKVYFSARDFIYLADEIDLIEQQFKVNMINSLNSINTYFRADGSIVYDSGQNEVASDDQKIRMPFESLLNGIRQSQSITSLTSVQAVDQNGNALFYTDENAQNGKEILNNTTSDSGYPIYYQEVSAKNMSAGTAAWVNGKLIRGNGADNKISWDNGYKEGYSQGVADSLGKANIVYQYHKHEGNGNTVGGCYGNLTQEKPVKCGCSSYSYTQINGQSTCGNCAHNHGSSQCSYVVNYTTENYIGVVCGKTPKTIESVTIVY